MDSAPQFPEVLTELQKFMIKHGLIGKDGERLARFCWCSDGPYDIRDFVVKQCFISKERLPPQMRCIVQTPSTYGVHTGWNAELDAGRRSGCAITGCTVDSLAIAA